MKYGSPVRSLDDFRSTSNLDSSFQQPSRQPLSLRQQSRLAARSTTPAPPKKYFRLKRNDLLDSHSKGLWRIHSGYVRTLSWTQEGTLVPLGFWGKGDIIGYPIAQATPYQAKCLSVVEVESLGTTYGFSQEQVLAQVRQSNDLLKISHYRQAEAQLLEFICWLAQRFGQPVREGHLLKIRLTHQEIAESIGITRVTVSRLLKALEREKKIRWRPAEKIVARATLANSDACRG
ncbi:MAG: Crp/Fnr family transcriptional regulator [Cyanobacteria bacterium J06634_5]